MSETGALRRGDRGNLLHPFARIGVTTNLPMISSGEGVRLVDDRGRVFLDGCSGLLNVNLGYGRPELIEAAARSMRSLSYASLFFGRGSAPAARLFSELAEVTPSAIARFFPTLGGSDAIETAIKLVRLRNSVLEKPEKHHIIGRSGSYHGTTIGAASLSGDRSLWEHFGCQLPGFSHVPQPGDDAAEAVASVEAEILSVGAQRVAAFIAEPISMTPGAPLPPEGYWQGVADVCRRHDVLLVLDETITGFGRTGKMFCCEHWNISPDLLVGAKGITSGYAPLGFVGMTERVARDLERNPSALAHGFTAGAHPVSCGVASATLKVMASEGLVECSAVLGEYLLRQLQALVEHRKELARARGIGSLVVVDLEQPTSRLGELLVETLVEQRLLIRDYAGASTFCFGPSFTASTSDIDEMVILFERALDEACDRTNCASR